MPNWLNYKDCLGNEHVNEALKIALIQLKLNQLKLDESIKFQEEQISRMQKELDALRVQRNETIVAIEQSLKEVHATLPDRAWELGLMLSKIN